jgi:ATP-dependent RNA helicase RhlE
VATDIVARGIDVEELGHVINFDVPADSDAYIHRVGRTARAEAKGDAFTFVAPEEEADMRAIEKRAGVSLPRITLPDFDYSKRTQERLEVPIRERLAAHRATQGPRRQGGQHAPAGARPRAASGGRHQSSTGSSHGGHASSHRNKQGGGHSRLQAVLDKHAPVSKSPGAKPTSSGGAHAPRRRGR